MIVNILNNLYSYIYQFEYILLGISIFVLNLNLIQEKLILKRFLKLKKLKLIQTMHCER